MAYGGYMGENELRNFSYKLRWLLLLIKHEYMLNEDKGLIISLFRKRYRYEQWVEAVSH